MVERDDIMKQYSYKEMSSKVEHSRRSRRPRGEPTGEAEGLAGKEVGRMGDRIGTEKPQAKAPAKKKQKLDDKKPALARLTTTQNSILDIGDLDGYQPTTEATREAYGALITLIGSRTLLGSQDPRVVRDAAQEVIATLKDPNLRDLERQEAISRLLTNKKALSLGGLTAEQFTALVQHGKQMDDYWSEQATQDQVDETNDEMGVAVVFDDSEDEEDAEDKDTDAEGVVQDSSSSSDDEKDTNAAPAADSDDEERVNQGASVDKEKKRKSRSADRVLSVHEIDAHFLQRQLTNHFEDADQAAKVAAEILDIIDIGKEATDLRECENRLLVLLGFDLFDTIKLVLNNRVRIWACVSMKRAKTDEERDMIKRCLLEEPAGEGKVVWQEMNSKGRAEDWRRERMRDANVKVEGDVSRALDSVGVKSGENDDAMDVDKVEAEELDLVALAHPDGSHTMSNKTCDLPESTFRATKKGYEEVHVPATRSVIPKGEKLIALDELPDWTHAAFKGVEKLNRVQSKMCDVALRSSENLLLCAPTGAGKTNVACLTMLNVLGQYRKEVADDDSADSSSSFDLSAFKIVYISPMKALVQEQVKNFSDRLKEYGVVVRELSGDSSLTRQQIAETQMLVTTPEKWDIVTRQGEGRAFTQLVKLVIIDEIHLLHDERGPVLESIVARVIRQVESTAEPVRLVGLSATLPNYADVATFLRVRPDKGLFFFDHSFRPVPLQMQYVGITERNAFKRFKLQNEICYEKAMDQRKGGNQVLIFVHSRAETGKTAKALRDLAREHEELSAFVREGGATQEILREESSTVKNADLKDVLPYGFAIHHAGMVREDRELVEDLFADRHIAVLCTTATLAWGVNLPAHAVIIKGTQIYDPAKGRWAELSPLDILQMLGRAGRPQYDSEGEGIIITQHSELQYYLSLTNLQLPVESQMIKPLADHLNAEIVLGTVQSIEEGAEWLSYTFLYVRMMQNPVLYGTSEASRSEDPTLKRHRVNLIHTAASMLEKSHLIRYDRRSGALQATPLGRVASQFYIGHSSMSVYTRHMRPTMSDIELLRLFSLSGEFSHITVREDEKLELTKLAGRVPIPVKESPTEPSAKINILLQAYISRLKLEGFALVADMAFIQQSAARIMRALFEIAVRRKWASLAKLCLDMSNMVSYRVWRSQSPLRQFRTIPDVVARKLERKSDIEWNRYADLTPSDLGELVGVAKMGRVLHKFIHKFPRLDLSASVQPISRSLLRIELILTSAFQFDVNLHGYVQLFHVFVEDVNGEAVLHHEVFSLKSTGAEEEHVLTVYVPVMEPLQPTYFIRVISDQWLHSSTVLPVSLSSLILPSKFPPPTELLDLQPLLPSSLGVIPFANMFPFKEFNPIQTQTFRELFKTDKNCLICSPSGSGKTTCGVFAILRMLTASSDGICLYVAPTEDITDQVYDEIASLLGKVLPSGAVTRLSGETMPDLKALVESRVSICTVKNWDILSRHWRKRKAVQKVALMIFDDMHFLGGQIGPTYEVIVSRTRYMNREKENEGSAAIRIVGLSSSLANARDVGEWMGVSPKSLFNFSPKSRATPLELIFHSFEQSNYSGRLLAMAKPVYNVVDQHADGRPSIVFVPSRRQVQLSAIDLMTYREGHPSRSFINGTIDEATLSSVREPALRQVLQAGIGFVYAGMLGSDQQATMELFSLGIIRILVVSFDACWKLRAYAPLIVIMGTETFDGREARHVDIPASDLLYMIGRHDPTTNGKCVILCHAPKKDYLKRLVYEPLPIESHLDSYLHDPLNAEIVTKTVSSMQDAIDYLTWTFLYRRLAKNPTYYGLRGTSNEHLSEHLSEMVETVVGDLEESRCCQLTEEGDISPLNLGMVAAYYYVQYRTIELMASSVTEKTKTRGILEILAASWEFSSLSMRFREDKTLQGLASKLVYPLPEGVAFDSNTKALILLQSHFSRKPVSSDLRTDQRLVVKDSVNLIQSLVDVISSNGWLKPALAAMELSQMVVQGLWNKDHALKQIPHFTDEIIKRCTEYEGEDPIEGVFDILTLDDDVRNDLLRLPDRKMADVAVFCNAYPNIEVNFEVEDPDSVEAGDPVRVVVALDREVDEDMSDDELAALGTVAAPLFPATKKENWWIVIGDTSTNSLLSLKRVTLRKEQKIALEFLAPEDPGEYNLTLFCMSDSYLGCDQEYSISLNVAAANNDSSDDDSD